MLSKVSPCGLHFCLFGFPHGPPHRIEGRTLQEYRPLSDRSEQATPITSLGAQVRLAALTEWAQEPQAFCPFQIPAPRRPSSGGPGLPMRSWPCLLAIYTLSDVLQTRKKWNCSFPPYLGTQYDCTEKKKKMQWSQKPPNLLDKKSNLNSVSSNVLWFYKENGFKLFY